MDFFDLLEQRRACHNFLPGKTIPKEDLVKMVEKAGMAPSGYNAQPWEFVIVQEEGRLKQLKEIAFEQPHLADVSAVVVVVADTIIGRNTEQMIRDWIDNGYATEDDVLDMRNSFGKKRSPQKLELMAIRNSMTAAMTLIYAAENMGYATCPMMGFSHKKLIPFLGIPEDRAITLMIALGYRDEGKGNPRLPRKKTEDLIHWEKFE